MTNFHPYPNRTYRIYQRVQPEKGSQWKFASTPLPLYASLVADTNIVEEAVNIYPAFNGTASTDTKELSLDGAFTEPSFFKVFGFTLAAGNSQTALVLPNSMVITKAAAARFWQRRPNGPIRQLKKTRRLLNTGVLNDVPGKSHTSL